MKAGACFVDLSASSDEDDDDDVVCLTEFPAYLLQRSAGQAVSDASPEVHDDVVILDFSRKEFGRDGFEKSSQKSSQNSSLLDDDCCILDADPSKVESVKTSYVNDTEDLVVTGESGPVACRDFPHARHLCVHFPFKRTSHRECCSQCHCYVCDILAPCLLWGDGTHEGDHCHASDRVGEKWKLLRESNQSQNKLASQLLSLQQVATCRTSSPAASSGSGARGSSFSPGYDHLCTRFKESVADDLLSDLISSDRVSTVTNMLGAPASAHNSSRGFAMSSRLSTGSIESASHRDRESFGSHLGVSARPHYPLQIKLPLRNHDLSSQSRTHHSRNPGVQTKIQKFVRRKESVFSSLYPPCRPGREGSFQNLLSRTSVNNCSTQNLLAHSFSSPSSTQTSQSAFSAFLPRTVEATVLHEPLEDPASDLSLILDNHLLREVPSPPSFVTFPNFGSGDLQHQCPISEPLPACPPFHIGIAPSQRQNEVHTYEGMAEGTASWSCNSIFEGDSQLFRGETNTENKTDGNMESLLSSPPKLLIDYLLGGAADFWSNSPPSLP